MTAVRINGRAVNAIAGHVFAPTQIASLIVAAGVASVPLAIAYAIVRRPNLLLDIVVAVAHGSILLLVKEGVKLKRVRKQLKKCLKAEHLKVSGLRIEEVAVEVCWTDLTDLPEITDDVVGLKIRVDDGDEFGQWFVGELQSLAEPLSLRKSTVVPRAPAVEEALTLETSLARISNYVSGERENHPTKEAKFLDKLFLTLPVGSRKQSILNSLQMLHKIQWDKARDTGHAREYLRPFRQHKKAWLGFEFRFEIAEDDAVYFWQHKFIPHFAYVGRTSRGALKRAKEHVRTAFRTNGDAKNALAVAIRLTIPTDWNFKVITEFPSWCTNIIDQETFATLALDTLWPRGLNLEVKFRYADVMWSAFAQAVTADRTSLITRMDEYVRLRKAASDEYVVCAKQQERANLIKVGQNDDDDDDNEDQENEENDNQDEEDTSGGSSDSDENDNDEKANAK